MTLFRLIRRTAFGKRHFEKEVQHIPQKYEMGKLMRAIQNEPILYRADYTLAITTGLRRGELCASGMEGHNRCL